MRTDLHDKLLAIETRLLQPKVRRSRDAVSEVLADDFVEFGSSGRIYSKQQVLDALRFEASRTRTLQDYRIVELVPGVCLATYRVVLEDPAGPDTYTLRSSIWKLADGHWRLLFHQATAQHEQ
jgi:hypothetical protein